MFAYYDPDADVAWLPTGESDDVVSERVPGGLHDYDRTTRQLVAIEVWAASTAYRRPSSKRCQHQALPPVMGRRFQIGEGRRLSFMRHGAANPSPRQAQR